jgi:general secretion pathway protein D
MDQVTRLIEELDEMVEPPRTVVVALKYANATAMVTLLSGIAKGEGVTSIVADANTNLLVIQARPDKCAEIMNVVRKIDVAKK